MQTQRSLDNFKIGGVAENMPLPLIHSLALIKAAAARANYPAGDAVGSVIEKAALEVAAGLHDAHFPLKIWQTGSGTQTNMNGSSHLFIFYKALSISPSRTT